VSEAVLENGRIVIRVPVANMQQIVEGAWATNKLTTRIQVTDATAFAADLHGTEAANGLGRHC